ncbi:glycoside hydrolase family 20 zincin-like fold domain-containing protein [Streptacidiphilus monticola]
MRGEGGPQAERVAALAAPLLGLPLGPDGNLRLRLDRASGLPAEGYRLQSDADGVTVVAGDGAGLWYGVQTLRQLPSPSRRASSRTIPGTPTGAGCWTWPGTSSRWRTCCGTSTCWPPTSATCCTCT